MSTVRKSAFFLTIAALAAVAPDATAQERGAVSGCYVPPTGLVYVVGAPGAPDDCLDQRHVSFTWPDVGQVATKPGKGNGPPADGGGSGGPGAGAPGGAPTVPSGAVMHFDLAACPSGWTEMEAARGRTLTGVPDGGTLGGAVGIPLSDRENRAHDHSVPGLFAKTAGAGTHGHEIAGSTSSAGEHAHRWSVFSFRDWHSWTESGVLQRLTNWTNGIGAEGEGDFPLSRRQSANVSLYTEPVEGHQHAFEAEASEAGNHSHALKLPARETEVRHTGDVMPYLQLLACRKD